MPVAVAFNEGIAVIAGSDSQWYVCDVTPQEHIHISDHIHIKSISAIAPEIEKAMEPVYTRMSDPNLLKRRPKGKTLKHQ